MTQLQSPSAADREQYKIDNVIAYILALMVFLPTTTVFNGLRVLMVSVIFAYVYFRDKQYDVRVSKIAIMIMVSPLIPLIFVFFVDNVINIPFVVHEVMRMIFVGFLIMAVSKLQISFRTVYFSTLIVFLPNLYIQIQQKNGNSQVFDWIERYYAGGEESTHLELARGAGGSFRSGSIFLNPNVYMVLILSMIVVLLRKDMVKPSLVNYVLLGGAMYSCFLTGSRTGMFVMIVLIGVYVLFFSKPLSRFVIIIGIAVYLLLFANETLFSSRSLDFREAGSLTAKIQGFGWYWGSTVDRFVYWVTGCLGAPNVSYIDCEWGHIYTWYGIYGYYWYFRYYRLTWHRNPGVPFYAIPVSVVCMLGGITASILLCMPVYSYVCVLMFAELSADEKSGNGKFRLI